MAHLDEAEKLLLDAERLTGWKDGDELTDEQQQFKNDWLELYEIADDETKEIMMLDFVNGFINDIETLKALERHIKQTN